MTEVEVVSAVGIATGLLPLAWLSGLRVGGIRRAPSWWLMALAFAVSFVADVASFKTGHALMSHLYLVTQGGLFAFALAPTRVVDRFVPFLLVAAGVSLGWRQGDGVDWLLHTVTCGGVVWLAWRNVSRETLARTMMLGFTLLALSWGWYSYSCAAGDYPTAVAVWEVHIGVRLATAAGWMWAVWQSGNPPTRAA